MAATPNPYGMASVDSRISDVPEYATPETRAYAAPGLEEGAAYLDNPSAGYAARLQTSTTEIPSAQRLQTIPLEDYYAGPTDPQGYYRHLDRDHAYRHDVEYLDADGRESRAGVYPTDLRWAPNPRLTPPAEPRPMQRMSPSTWMFTRPWDQFNRTHWGDPPTGSARTFNGTHFSMADHRRRYDILGMAPVRTMRNTYRLEPAPWDVDIVDMPPQMNPVTTQSRMTGMEVPAGPRSWRLT